MVIGNIQHQWFVVITRFSTIFCGFVLLFNGACSTSTHERPNNQEIKNNRPHWIDNPSLKGHLSITASAMPQNMGGLLGQRRAALLRARAELAKNSRVVVSKSFSSKKVQDQNNPVINQSLSTQANELQTLENARIHAEWSNPDNGELFIWYVIPKK